MHNKLTLISTIMKKYFFLAACCMLATGFISCSDDDDNSGKDGSDNSTGTQTGTNTAPNVTENLGIQFPVTSIRTQYGTNVFNYTNGKLLSGITDDECNFTITENPLKINIIYRDYDDEYEEINITNIKTNTNGFATSVDFEDIYNSGHENDVDHGTFTFKYDSDGHIIEQAYKYNDEDYKSVSTATYTWNNGNLTKIHIYEESTEEEYNEIIDETYTYTYGDASQNPNPGIFFESMYNYTYDFMWYAGLLGKPTKNIPTSLTYVSSYTENGTNTYTSNEQNNIYVNYNPNGSVASIKYSDLNGYSSTEYYGYNGEPAAANIQTGISNKTIKSPRIRHHRK